MSFKRAADGIAKKGKTVGKNYGDSGPSVGVQSGPKKSLAGGKTNEQMMKLGRNLAKVAAQKKG